MTTHREEGKKLNTNIYVNKLEDPSYKTLETTKINLAEQRRRMEWEQRRVFLAGGERKGSDTRFPRRETFHLSSGATKTTAMKSPGHWCDHLTVTLV